MLCTKSTQKMAKSIGAYIVLDKKDQINGDSFLGAVKDAAEMGDKVSQFLAKAI